MSARKQLAVAFGGFAASLALAIPTVASAGLVDDVLGGVNDTVNDAVGGLSGGNGGSSGGSSGGSGSPTAAPTPTVGPETEPPLSDTDPHGQGAVIDTDIDNPVLQDLGVTVGESRGEQDSQGKYHGVVKVVSVTGLGNPVEIAIDTDEGESASGPTMAVNDALDDLCTASDVCLNVLDYSSDTDGNGSDNSFSAVRLGTPSDAVSASVLESEGNISETKKCQTAEGSSSAAGVGVLGNAVEADALNSSSKSKACSDGSQDTDADSNVAQLNGNGLLAGLGCDEDQVDDEFPDAPLNALVAGVCNGDDTNGAQADAPYNVRKALGLEVLPAVLPLLGVGVTVDASKSESLAVAPDDDAPPPACPDPNNPRCDDDPENPDDPNQGLEFGGGDGTGSVDSSGSLPFTGADLGVLGLIGALVMGGGLGLMAMADRRRTAKD